MYCSLIEVLSQGQVAHTLTLGTTGGGQGLTVVSPETLGGNHPSHPSLFSPPWLRLMIMMMMITSESVTSDSPPFDFKTGEASWKGDGMYLK